MRAERELNKYAYFKSIGYEPHAGQRAFHDSEARFRVLCAGTRFGKSMCASYEVIPELLVPHTYVAIFAPTYKLGEKEFKYIYDSMLIRQRIGCQNKVYNKAVGQMMIKFPWDSFVEVYSVENPESVLGGEYDHIILSEGSRISQDVLERYIMGRLGSRMGKMTVPTTPAGAGGWLEEFFNRGQDRKSWPEYESWQFPTWSNPHHPKDHIRQMKQIMSKENFSEQYEGKFVRFSGRVYAEFDTVIHRIPFFRPDPSWRRECGVDFGFVHPFACVWVAFDYDGNAYVYDEYKKSGKIMREHADVMKYKTGTDKVDFYWADPSARQQREELASEGITTFEAQNDVAIGIERVRQRMFVNKATGKPRMFIMDNCVELIKELHGYHYMDSDSYSQRERPEKINDDLADALRYVFARKPSSTEKIEETVFVRDSWQRTFDEIAQDETKREFIGNQIL